MDMYYSHDAYNLMPVFIPASKAYYGFFDIQTGEEDEKGAKEKLIQDREDIQKSGDNEAYKVNFYSTFTNLGCRPSHLDFFKRTPNLNNLILNQDAIFVGGGNTKTMLAVWKEWGLDKILKKAYNDGIVMSGVSAGAICWFQNGITDSWKDHQAVLPCLGFVDGNLSLIHI